jgi:hypothetical protein
MTAINASDVSHAVLPAAQKTGFQMVYIAFRSGSRVLAANTQTWQWTFTVSHASCVTTLPAYRSVRRGHPISMSRALFLSIKTTALAANIVLPPALTARDSPIPTPALQASALSVGKPESAKAVSQPAHQSARQMQLFSATSKTLKVSYAM